MRNGGSTLDSMACESVLYPSKHPRPDTHSDILARLFLVLASLHISRKRAGGPRSTSGVIPEPHEKPWSEQLRPHVLPSFSFGRESKKTLLLGRLLSSRPLSERRARERRSSSPARGSMRSWDAPQRSDGGPEALNNGLGGVLAVRGREPFLLFEVHISR